MAEALDGIPRDARLLVLFDEIYRSQSMTRAAEKLGLSQPTVSIWLGKLRRQLADPLFVRTSVRRAADAARRRADRPGARSARAAARHRRRAPSFDAASSDRVFRIAMTDASHITLLPRLLGRVRADAPRRASRDRADLRADAARAGERRGRPRDRLHPRARGRIPRAGALRAGLRLPGERAPSAHRRDDDGARLPGGGAHRHPLGGELHDAADLARAPAHPPPRAARAAGLPRARDDRVVHRPGRDRAAAHRRDARGVRARSASCPAR